jgi:hypothetical protein
LGYPREMESAVCEAQLSGQSSALSLYSDSHLWFVLLSPANGTNIDVISELGLLVDLGKGFVLVFVWRPDAVCSF